MSDSTELEIEIEGEESPEILEALAIIAKNDEDGLLEPHAVVEEARNPDSPLHGQFEWDDSIAGHEYRIWQARSLLARVKVRIIDVGRSRAFVNVRVRSSNGTERRGYLPIERVATDPDLYSQAIEDARRGIASYARRLTTFEKARTAVTHLQAALLALDENQDTAGGARHG